ncbi:hypothetical protein [Cucumibacter marinus]|uniref:hypothetical protein n=1 Tax=Cucumibacter marinus TaxID=1121252 RepID=UPI0006864CAE|nr:hypothetical protein [Cucumibacter marinus]
MRPAADLRRWRGRSVPRLAFVSLVVALCAQGLPGLASTQPDSAGIATAEPAVEPDLRSDSSDHAAIRRDLSVLPAPVAATRDALIAAALTGDVEALRPLVESQDRPPNVSFGVTTDAIDHLRTASNDGAGRELLGILAELLEAPYSIIGEDSGEPIYVWPAFSAMDLDALSPRELVETYKIVSHSDLEEMRAFGGWYFYRVGIAANGDWLYFIAGD